jgi:hypothetical protein
LPDSFGLSPNVAGEFDDFLYHLRYDLFPPLQLEDLGLIENGQHRVESSRGIQEASRGHILIL